LREAASAEKDALFEFGARPQVDLLRPASIEKALAKFRPDVVINPAAYTAVDKAESEIEQAFAINRDGAKAVARAADNHRAPIIHISTDYVFDGKKQAPYIETDPTAPLGVYGKSKLEGEQVVAAANPRHIVLRTCWVYAPFGNNFVRTMLRLAAEHDRLRVVSDQIGCPTYAPDIASAIIAIARMVTVSGWKPEFAGVTHLAGPDAVSWHDFAKEIIAQSSTRGGRSVPVDPIATSDYPTPARRPSNSRLSTARLESVFSLHLPSMQSSLADCLDQLLLRTQK
jgi:dTDP-4-dehydrorhamnose reductase